MARKLLAVLVAFCALGALAVIPRPARADAEGITGELPLPDATPQFEGFTAVIAAPSVVNVSQSRSFPVRIQLLRISGNEPFPTKVTLTAFETIQSGKETGWGNLDIPLSPDGAANAVVSFSQHPYQKEPVTIYVKPVGKPYEFMGKAEIALRYAENWKDLQKPPKVLPADGKSTGTLRIQVKDQFGEPLEGVPGIMNIMLPIPGPLHRESVVVWTDAQGIITFKTPALTTKGTVSCQLMLDSGLVSNQYETNYQDVPEQK